jgi:hypothetical protein
MIAVNIINKINEAMVNLFWMEGRISERLFTFLNGINTPTPTPDIVPPRSVR